MGGSARCGLHRGGRPASRLGSPWVCARPKIRVQLRVSTAKDTLDAADAKPVDEVTSEPEGDALRCLQQTALLEGDAKVDVHELCRGADGEGGGQGKNYDSGSRWSQERLTEERS